MNNLTVFTSTQEVDKLIELSEKKAIALFKHSTTCPISKIALDRVVQFEKDNTESLTVHYLDLLSFRPVSNYIAEKLDIQHESPQFIVLEKGKVKAVQNHLNINPSEVLV